MDWTMRTRMMYTDNEMSRLREAHVAVLGLGGVGSYAAEALCRAGIGALTIVDCDDVSETNLNRQLIALRSTIGQPKTTVMAKRLMDINPDCRVTPLLLRYEAETKALFWQHAYDYVVDAIDLVSCKLDLITEAKKREVPILSALGTGNKTDPSRFRIGDISKTRDCPLARVMRKELRVKGILHTDVLWSDELPRTPRDLDTPPPGRRSIPASVPWVPAGAGLLMAGYTAEKLMRG